MNKKNLLEITSNFPDVKEHLYKENSLKKELKKEQRRLKTLITKYLFLIDLVGIGSNDDKLDNAIKKFFKEIGFKDVRKISKKFGAEDLQLWFDDKLLLIEATGFKSQNAEENKGMQVKKWIPIRQDENPDKSVFGLLIVNHNNKIKYDKRKIPFNARYIKIAESNKIGIITTTELLKSFSLLKNNILSLNQFKDKICLHGMIEFK
jgi:hypothetical protein